MEFRLEVQVLKPLISRTAVLSLQRTSLIPELSFKNGSYKSHGLEANDGISVSPADQNSFSVQEGALSRKSAENAPKKATTTTIV
mgnify:CR=1 FL=1